MHRKLLLAPSVNIELAVLRVSPGEFTLILLLEVEAAVHMIEGEVPNGAPAVRYQVVIGQVVTTNLRKIRQKTFPSHFSPRFTRNEL